MQSGTPGGTSTSSHRSATTGSYVEIIRIHTLAASLPSGRYEEEFHDSCCSKTVTVCRRIIPRPVPRYARQHGHSTVGLK